MGFVDLAGVERDKTGRVPRVPFDPNYRFATSEPSRGYVHQSNITAISGLAPCGEPAAVCLGSGHLRAEPTRTGSGHRSHRGRPRIDHAVCALAKNRKVVRVSVVATPDHDGIRQRRRRPRSAVLIGKPSCAMSLSSSSPAASASACILALPIRADQIMTIAMLAGRAARCWHPGSARAGGCRARGRGRSRSGSNSARVGVSFRRSPCDCSKSVRSAAGMLELAGSPRHIRKIELPLMHRSAAVRASQALRMNSA